MSSRLDVAGTYSLMFTLPRTFFSPNVGALRSLNDLGIQKKEQVICRPVPLSMETCKICRPVPLCIEFVREASFARVSLGFFCPGKKICKSRLGCLTTRSWTVENTRQRTKGMSMLNYQMIKSRSTGRQISKFS